MAGGNLRASQANECSYASSARGFVGGYLDVQRRRRLSSASLRLLLALMVLVAFLRSFRLLLYTASAFLLVLLHTLAGSRMQSVPRFCEGLSEKLRRDRETRA